MDRYEAESQSDIKNNEFYKDIHKKLSNDFNNLLKDLAPNFIAKFSFGIGGWAKHPFISIIEKDESRFNYAFSLFYAFDIEKSEINIILRPKPRNKLKFGGYVQFAKDLLIDENIDFKYSNRPFTSSFLLKTYAYDELDEDVFIKDLEYYITLFKQVNVGCNNISSVYVINDLKKILDKNELRSVNENNEFYNNMSKRLSKHFNDLLSDFTSNYFAIIYFDAHEHSTSDISIIEKNKQNKNPYVLGYALNSNNSEINVIIRPNYHYSKFEDYVQFAKDLLIDENIDFKYSNRPFASSFLLKTYTYDQLDENTFIKDLKYFISIFEQVNSISNLTMETISNDFDEKNVLDDFKSYLEQFNNVNETDENDKPSNEVVKNFHEILDKYESEKEIELKKSSLAFKLNNLYTKNVERFVNGINNNSDANFSVRSSFGINSWVDRPVISIFNENLFDSFQEGLHINYTFDTKSSKIYLSINPRSKNETEYLDLKELLMGKLNKSNFIVPKGFIIGNNEIDEYSIILKEYVENEIDDRILENDLKGLLPIYSTLCETYKEYLKNQEESSDIRILEFKSIYDSRVFVKSIFNNSSDNSINVLEIENNPYEYFNLKKHPNELDNFQSLLSEENKNKLKNLEFNYSSYEKILENIINSASDSFRNIITKNNIKNDDFISFSPRDKILLFAKSFADVEYKSLGIEYGYLAFNKIFVDDRLPEPQIITTILHELSHFILSEILEQIVMDVFDTNKTPIIESYICLTLEEDLWYLLDEFCAHTVEGRYTLHGYQDYGSFEYKYNEVSEKYAKEDIDYCLNVANTFAQHIKYIFEIFIPNQLRDEIKNEFKNLNEPRNNNGLKYERDTKLTPDGMMEAIKVILSTGVDSCISRNSELERFSIKFKERCRYD